MRSEPLPVEIAHACRQVIADWDFEKFEEPFLKASKATFVCESKLIAPLGNAPVGSTKVGGFPDLPDQAEWPQFDGRYLPFIAQLDLADLPALEGNPLPATGRMYYFYWCTNECSDEPASVLWLTDDTRHLSRREVPNEQILVDWQGESLYEEQMATRFSVGITISSPLVEDFAREQGLLSQDESIDEIWGSFPDDYSEEVSLRLERGLHNDDQPDEGEDEEVERLYTPLIELLGFPDPCDYYLSSLKPALGGHSDGTDLWQNILSIYSHNNMMWSDVGTLGFFVRDADLRGRDFSRVQAHVMSS